MIHFTNTHGVIAPNGTMAGLPADMRTRHEPKAANADEPTKGIINAALNVKVRKDNGTFPDDYAVRDGNTCTLIEYYVQHSIQDMMRDVMKEIVNEQRPMFKELIKKSLASKKTQASIVESFLASLMENMSHTWNTNVDIKFVPRKGLC